MIYQKKNNHNCCNYFDVFRHHIDRINKQFVWRVHQQRVIMPEFNKINAIKELLNVKYNFASVSVLDWLTLFSVSSHYILNSHIFLFYFYISMY